MSLEGWYFLMGFWSIGLFLIGWLLVDTPKVRELIAMACIFIGMAGWFASIQLHDQTKSRRNLPPFTMAEIARQGGKQ